MASTSKAVIVTGAASGIGLAMTMGLIEAGHDVTAVDRNAAALAELEKQAAGLKGSVQTVTADLTQPDSFAHVAGSTLIKYGRIDALVNNAGIGQASVRRDRRPIRFWETTAEQWGRFIAVNAAGPINMARAVLPHMLAAKHGRIVTVTTSLGTMVREGFLLYGSSKAAAEIGDGCAGRRSRRQRRYIERSGTGRHDRHASRRRCPEPRKDAQARHHDPAAPVVAHRGGKGGERQALHRRRLEHVIAAG